MNTFMVLYTASRRHYTIYRPLLPRVVEEGDWCPPVGIIALAAGASDFYGVDLPLFPILIILIGVGIIIGVLTEKKPS